MKIVDTRGLTCPAPLIATKRAIKDTAPGEALKIMTDNKTSLSNLTRFLTDNRVGFSTEKGEDFWTITIINGTTEVQYTDPEVYCTTGIPHFTKGKFVIAFTSDTMGQGDEKLGHQLMVNFVRAIKDLDKLPAKMVFYNRGVFLGAEDSPVAQDIRELGTMGVQIFFCATCVSYYSLEDKIKTGSLSNMYEIVQIMASADNVVKP